MSGMSGSSGELVDSQWTTPVSFVHCRSTEVEAEHSSVQWTWVLGFYFCCCCCCLFLVDSAFVLSCSSCSSELGRCHRCPIEKKVLVVGSLHRPLQTDTAPVAHRCEFARVIRDSRIKRGLFAIQSRPLSSKVIRLPSNVILFAIHDRQAACTHCPFTCHNVHYSLPRRVAVARAAILQHGGAGCCRYG